MDVFSNRELALIIWGSGISAYILFFPKMGSVRKSFKKILSSFFVNKIQAVFFLMLMYICGIIYLLSQFNIWDFSQLKNTVIWTFSIAFMSFFQIEAIKKDRKFFKHAVLDNLKLIAIIEFIIGVYSFPLIVELVLLPILTVVVAMSAVADTNEKYSQVKNFLNGLMVILGFLVLGYAAYMLFSNVGAFATEQTFYDFTIPPILTLLFVPFIFSLMVYMSYETSFIRINYSIKPTRQRAFAKVLVMLVFNVRIELLERWLSELTNADTNSYRGIWGSVKKIFKMKKAEQSPQEINISEGWSPYKAKDFLCSHGFITGYYHESFDEWYACSPLIDLGKGSFPNNIAYYIEGSETVAKNLKLKLNINNIDTAGEAHEKLLEAGRELFESATNYKFPSWLEDAIINGNPIEKIFECFKISLEKEEFQNRAFKGYDIKFIVSNKLP